MGIIRGGEATNVVTDRVTVTAEARSHDPIFRRQILAQIEKSFRAAAKRVRNAAGKCGRVTCDSRLDYESFLLKSDEQCVNAAEAAVRSVGREPERAVANGGVDANWITARGIPTVTLGCGQRHQHTVHEALSISEFEDACRIALRLATAQECQ